MYLKRVALPGLPSSRLILLSSPSSCCLLSVPPVPVVRVALIDIAHKMTMMTPV